MMPADSQALRGPGVTQGGGSDFQAGCLNLYAVRHMFFHAAAKTRAAHMCKLVASKLAANGQQAGLTHVQVVASKLATHMHKTLVVASIFTMATHIRCSQDKVTPDKMAG